MPHPMPRLDPYFERQRVVIALRRVAGQIDNEMLYRCDPDSDSYDRAEVKKTIARYHRMLTTIEQLTER